MRHPFGVDRPELALHLAYHFAMPPLREVNTAAQTPRGLVQQEMSRLLAEADCNYFGFSARILNPERVGPAWARRIALHMNNFAAECFYIGNRTCVSLVELFLAKAASSLCFKRTSGIRHAKNLIHRLTDRPPGMGLFDC